MHNNYYLLRQLSPILNQKLKGFSVSSCFSQSKDELIIGFHREGQEFYIKATLTPQFSCLSFLDKFERARKNSVDLFKDIIDEDVVEVRQFENERAFMVVLSKEKGLLFKMHGNRSNILMIQNEQVTAVFNQSLKKDLGLEVGKMDRPLDQSKTFFKENEGNYKMLFPTFGPVIKAHLRLNNYETCIIDNQWNLIQSTLKMLYQGSYFIVRFNDKLSLSLLRIGDVIDEFKSPIDALNTYFHMYSKVEHLSREKMIFISNLNKQIQKGERYADKLKDRLKAIETGTSYNKIADVIMANMHAIPKGQTEISLFNFYDESQIIIALKKGLSPQKNAENYYRKSKNQKIEVAKIEENLAAKKLQIAHLKSLILKIEQCENFKELKPLLKEQGLLATAKKKIEIRPFKSFIIEGFDVWVGKNAKANDELTLKFTHKDDIWLHAKDVSGSHVVIKMKSGQKTPTSVLEKAASLAAYFSKRKSDTLCPVSYTPKKYVRKPKGFPAGAVVVDREDVILVKPGLPDDNE